VTYEFNWPLQERERLLLECAGDRTCPIEDTRDVAYAVLEVLHPGHNHTAATDLAYRLTGTTKPG
jgi:hypothetical protein